MSEPLPNAPHDSRTNLSLTPLELIDHPAAGRSIGAMSLGLCQSDQRVSQQPRGWAESLTRPGGSSAVNGFSRQLPIALADLGLSLPILVLTFVSTRNLPGLLDIVLLSHLPLSPSSQYAITSLSKYVVAGVGIVLAFNALGVDWSKVQWLVAAMTVGLALGLQEVFANLVSGIIVLFKRPIRVGDVVTVGNVSGVVSRTRIRATTITDWDRKERIVPNKRCITTEILNWTLSDAIIRVVFPVTVGRGVEAERIRGILLELAREHPWCCPSPNPAWC